MDDTIALHHSKAVMNFHEPSGYLLPLTAAILTGVAACSSEASSRRCGCDLHRSLPTKQGSKGRSPLARVGAGQGRAGPPLPRVGRGEQPLQFNRSSSLKSALVSSHAEVETIVGGKVVRKNVDTTNPKKVPEDERGKRGVKTFFIKNSTIRKNEDVFSLDSEPRLFQWIHDQLGPDALRGKDFKFAVSGKEICLACLVDIPAAARTAGVKSVTVFEEATGRIFFWAPGMKEKLVLLEPTIRK